jgi:hypothetical protein
MKIDEDDESLIWSCLAANQDAEVEAIEHEWDEIASLIDEPWSGDV